jgi:hypothetical protein
MSGLRAAGAKLLLKLRHAVDDAESHIVAQLDLNHFAGKVLTHLFDVLDAELQLTAAPFDEVIEQQGCQVLDLIVIGMVAEVQNLRHDGLASVAMCVVLIAEPSAFAQCPKWRGSR